LAFKGSSWLSIVLTHCLTFMGYASGLWLGLLQYGGGDAGECVQGPGAAGQDMPRHRYVYSVHPFEVLRDVCVTLLCGPLFVRRQDVQG
jgi:hypothetical protein